MGSESGMEASPPFIVMQVGRSSINPKRQKKRRAFNSSSALNESCGVQEETKKWTENTFGIKLIFTQELLGSIRGNGFLNPFLKLFPSLPLQFLLNALLSLPNT